MNDPFTVNPTAFRPFCTGTKRLYWTIGRMDRTVPPRPANSAPSVNWCPRWGEMPLSSVLNEKFGKILLVMIPFTAFGPEIPRNAMKSNSVFDAVLNGNRVVRSNEYVMPTRLNERRSGQLSEVVKPALDCE